MIAAILSGLLTGLSLPTALFGRLLPDLGFLAWVGLIPLYSVLRSLSVRQAFRAGLVYGLVHFSLSLYCLFIALHRYGEIPWGLSTLGVVVVAAIEAVFPAAACAVSSFVGWRGGSRGWSFVFAWVVAEFLRTYVPFGGFAWAGIAYSQRSWIELLQILDVTGVYGVLFLLVLANVLGGEVWGWLKERKGRPPSWFAAAFSILLVAAIVYGKFRLPQVRALAAQAPQLRVSVIQGNIPQDEKWLEERVEEIIAHHLVLTEEGEASDPDLIVWPEASFPAVVPPEITRIEELKKIKKPLLLGVVTYDGTIPEEWPPKADDPNFALHNSAMVLEPGGFIADRYHKVHLVPMGEYVPLGRYLPFLSTIDPGISNFTPGGEFSLMQMGAYHFGVTICFEDLFPEISRAFTRRGADFLANLTNNGWYDRSSAIYQHFDFSRFRAIENRRAMIRATNTGKTAFFGPSGEVIAEAPAFVEATLTAEIPLLKVKSLYTRFGDVFAWACVAVLGLVTLWSRYERN